jgi:hypothetical protein
VFKQNLIGKGWNNVSKSFAINYLIPLWLLILIFIAGSVLMFSLVYLAFKQRQNTEKVHTKLAPHWTSYTQDTFNDRFNGILIKWSWARVVGGYEFSNPRFCCPKDGCELDGHRCPVCDSFYHTSSINMTVIHKLIDNKLEKMTNEQTLASGM